MSVQLFGIDKHGKQVYECRVLKPKEAEKTADEILRNMSHVSSIVAIENVPNIAQMEERFVISYSSRFLFTSSRDEG